MVLDRKIKIKGCLMKRKMLKENKSENSVI